MTEENAVEICECGRIGKREVKSVTQVTEFSFSKFFSGGRAPPIRSFYDGLHAICRADQRDIRATVGE